ncbi:deleted in lung and esophageal cancer protein 1-like [Anneissia japonica]|uniref:deleted in lung and esophageal cancer protein 1-like n=1 Tax=Anneissia japonica TaxID=1529436 RepID=UPI001425662F|nr:deleted in lung and esophageal cancer protein 1-like [Anneissia japonica]
MSAEVDSLPDSEPPMFLQRPSSGSSQNVEHILAQTFRDFYTRDYVGQETVRNLNKSRAGDDSYHEKYVEELRKVQAEHERRLAEAAMLSRHIMQARAKALQADERDLEEAAKGCELYHQLGLPPGESNYMSFLDSNLLKKHNLIVPEDFSTAEPPLARPPRAAKAPHYSLATETSVQHSKFDIPPTDLRSNSSISTYSVIDPIRSEREQWKDHMSAEKRELNRKDLAMVYKKSDFLRNARHRPPSEPAGGKSLIKPNRVVHKLGGAKPKVTVTNKKEPSVVFLATPSTVVFTDYKVRQVYEMCLDLKNVSASSRQLRVIPPKTEYFSVGLGQFPGDYGIIAPGMSCQYKIRFIPDALIDFDDELQIQTQSSQPLIVKLQGRRKPPQLSLSSVIDCGYCLVGGIHVAQFIVKNTGGSGRFCIMPRDAWPATNLKSLNADRVKLEPFDVQPAMFELPAGYSTLLQVVFTPPSVETFTQNITMVCDNCHVKHFTLKGEGQSPGVRLVSVKPGGESFPVPGEICDTTAQHHVNFDTLNPMTYTEKKLQVQNTTNVDLPFFWEILKPHLECPDPMMTSSSSDHMISRVQEGGGNFCIAPDQGTLSANSTKDFIVGFSPTTVGYFHNVVHLLLKNIPVTDTTKSTSAKLVHNQQNETGNKSTSAASSSSRDPSTKDMVCLEVELKGECEEYHVLVQPYAIIVPGTMLVTTTIRKQFQMVNFSQYPVTFSWSSLSECHIIEVETPQGIIPPGEVADLRLTITGGQPGLIDHTLLCRLDYQDEPLTLRVRARIKMVNFSQYPVTFNWSSLSECHIIEVETPQGIIPPGEVADLRLTITGGQPGLIDHTLLCRLDYQDEPLTLRVRARIKGPEVIIDTPSVDFGLVRYGYEVTEEIVIRNMSQIPAKWSIYESKEFQDKQLQGISEFDFKPSSGELPALGSTLIRVTFNPTFCRYLSSVFECSIDNGKPCYIGVRADVKKPQACLLSSSLHMPEVYDNVQTQHKVQLLNQTLLPTRFFWGEVSYVMNIKGPEVIIDTPSVDFGLVRYGYEVTEEIVIRNISQIPAKWSIYESKEFQDKQLQGISEFSFKPSSGELPALGSTLIRVTFNPTFCRYLSSVFECSVDNGKPCYIGVRADVKKPQACLLSSSLHMPEVYDNVQTQHKVQLLNQTLLPTRFFWGEGELNDVYIPCNIEGMPMPVCLFLSSNVQGLNISYSIKDSQSVIIENDDLSLDFGEDVEVCTVTKRFVCIKNQTAIEAPYHILVSRFPAGKPPTPPDESKDKTRRRSLLNRTPNIADPMSKSPAKKQADFSKAVLHDGRGLAFVVHPSSGVLGPFAELNVEVSVYADMWGQYSDDLICKVGALENVVIPMKVSITGCPLNFQMASLKGQIPVVRFGTHIPGVATIKRPLRIINKSPFDVRVDWEIYNLEENDNKLLDMITSIGDPFPKRDENGLEIIPTAKEEALRLEEKPIEESTIPQIQAAVQPGNHQVIPDSEHPEEERNTQPRLIRVQLKEHEGNRTEQPFGITSKQMVIPARGSLQITATFSPCMVSLTQARTVECVGYALGFMSLDEEDVRFKKNIFERLHGYDMTPLRLDLTAFIKPAMLTIETSDDDGMLYSTAASHLLVDGRISKEYTKTGLATLTNSTETPLTFQLVVPEPFYLSNIEPAHFEGDQSFITIIPRHNLQIKVAFLLSSELIQRYLDLLQPDQEMEGVALTKRDQERKFTINKDLQIVYNNSSIQAIPLCATVVIPSLILSSDNLNFGVCLVGQQREKEIVLRNPTSSASFWTAAIDWCSTPDDVVFSLTPSSGMLEAYVTHVSNSKTLLKVHFTPRHNIAYDCIFILSGMLGEEPCYLRVKGEGSYDSRHEALVNI